MATLTLLRHGQSVWNRERRFTGWTDVGLSPRGVAQAEAAGRLLKATGCTFDQCFTSCLSRANETLRIVLETMGLSGVPIRQSWRLNERHYGALQGLTRIEGIWKYGLIQVLIWERHFDIRPPALDPRDARFPGHDPRYVDLDATELPRTESMKDTLARLLPYWHATIAPEIRQRKNILIVAHKNSLRGLCNYLDNSADADIPNVTIRTGKFRVYDMDANARPLGCEGLSPPTWFKQWTRVTLGRWTQRAAEK